MTLKAVREVELPDAPKSLALEEPKSESSSDRSQHLAAMLMLVEIRRVLNARASVILALVGAAALTYLAMEKATGMALSIAVSYDLFVFLPLAYIAYLRRKE